MLETSDMSSSVSLDVVANPPVRWEETLQIALLLAFAGGYLDAYAWIVHAAVGAFATKGIPLLALGIPVAALLIVLLRCKTQRAIG
jgi:hypothetical protein